MTMRHTRRLPDGTVLLPSGLIEGSPEAAAVEAEESARFDAEHGTDPGRAYRRRTSPRSAFGQSLVRAVRTR